MATLALSFVIKSSWANPLFDVCDRQCENMGLLWPTAHCVSKQRVD